MAASESSFRLMQLNTSRLLLVQLYTGASDGLFSCGRGAKGMGERIGPEKNLGNSTDRLCLEYKRGGSIPSK